MVSIFLRGIGRLMLLCLCRVSDLLSHSCLVVYWVHYTTRMEIQQVSGSTAGRRTILMQAFRVYGIRTLKMIRPQRLLPSGCVMPVMYDLKTYRLDIHCLPADFYPKQASN